MRKKKLIFIIPAAILGFLLFTAIGGAVVRMLWNWLLPPLFGWKVITFWQALGLLALSRILFGGHGFFRGARPGAYRRANGGWMRMTAEERERFRQQVRERCGLEPEPASGHEP
jgi:hypothetical protein